MPTDWPHPPQAGEGGPRPTHRQAQAPSKDRPRPEPGGPATPRPRKRALRIPLGSVPARLHAVLLALAIALSLCAGRLLQLQGVDSSAYAALSADQVTARLPLLPSRGDIADRNGVVLAATQPAVAVTADPTLTSARAEEIAGILSGPLSMQPGELAALLTKPNTHFVYIKKKVPAQTYTKISAELASRKIYGIFREPDPIRTYPGGTVGSSVIGFVGSDGKGLAGIELSMNRELAGVEGKESYEVSPNGSRIPLGTSTVVPAKDGLDLQLTLDSELQWVAERRLETQVRRTRADWGFAITMNVKTGEILAMANSPTVDPAHPGASASQDRGNRAIAAPYEPGSVEKVLTSGALLDSGAATPESRVRIPHRLRSGPLWIKDHFPHGELRYLMRGVIADSSNIGTVLLTRQLEKQRLHDYLTSFGLGSRTGVELPGESVGILPDADMSDVQRDQIAFGQALAVTGIQEAAAVAGLVNSGIYNPPTVIKRITDSSGRPVPIAKPLPRQIISESASTAVRDLMRAVVDSENGQQALKLDAYRSGGKTGTAQRADPTCKCYRGYVTSYVGFAPLNDPQLLTYVVLSNPRNGDTGSAVAAPAYHDIMEFALPRYSVEPDAKKSKPRPTEW
jgi:cell division protein FtsI (penicillin-binding protein 3)